MPILTESSPSRTSTRLLDVLVVEDNPLDAELVLEELHKAGFDVRAEIIHTSQEFYTRVTDHDYDVILADWHLPGWDGNQALDLLRELDRETPILFVTDSLNEHVIRECHQKGAADLVQKDCLARLPAAVERVLALKSLRAELAQAEASLRRSGNQQQRVAELYPEALFMVTGDKLTFLNPAAVHLLGANSPKQVLGKPLASVLHPECRVAISAQIEKLRDTEESASFTGKLQRLDGKTADVTVTATSLSFRNTPSVQLVVRDVTRRKRGEEGVTLLAVLADLNPNPILEFSRTGQLTCFNEAAGQMAQSLGFDHPREFLPEKTTGAVKMCLTTGLTKAPFETQVGQCTLSWSFYPIKQHQVVHCFITDVTERQRLETQLRHSQKLESVGRLAAGLAHDFNNVLTVIQGHAGLLRVNPKLPPEAAESLQAICRAAERATKLTSQLLLFSRKSQWQPRPLDLNQVLTNLSTILQRTLGEDIQFHFNYAPGLPPILADVGLIEQVVMSLAVNARDAMPKGGTLLLSTAMAEIDEVYVERHASARPGRFNCLTMIDTGCGMDQLTLSRLFEPFFTTKEFGKGTGLGLAIVYGIVQQHQGWIDVQSQVGQGTTFKIYLPPGESPPEQRAEPAPSSALRGGNETILVVEDEPPVRWIVRDVLERYGYRVLEAGAGVEALAVWHQHQQDIALLLTDVVMPAGLTGQELAEKFKHQKPDLKVIYTSGYSVHAANKDLELIDGLTFLQKPFDSERLALAVRKCLDH